MADDANTIAVRLKVIDEMSAELTKIRSHLDSQFDAMHQKTNALEGGFKKLMGAAMALASVGAVVSFLKSSAAAADEQAKANAKLANALGTTSKALLDQASALQLTSNYSDDAITSAQAMLAFWIKDEQQIKSLTPAIMDFASAMGIDLADAAKMVGKAIDGEAGMLGRYGITVKGAMGSAERLASIQQGLARFQGASNAAFQAGVGPLTVIGKLFNEMQETVGGVLIDSIKACTGSTGNLQQSMSYLGTGIGYVIKVGAVLATVISGVVTIFDGLFIGITAGIGGPLAALIQVMTGDFKGAARTMSETGLTLQGTWLTVKESVSDAIGSIGRLMSTNPTATANAVLSPSGMGGGGLRAPTEGRGGGGGKQKEDIHHAFGFSAEDLAAHEAFQQKLSEDAAAATQARIDLVTSLETQARQAKMTQQQVDLDNLDLWYGSQCELAIKNGVAISQVTATYTALQSQIDAKYQDERTKKQEEEAKKRAQIEEVQMTSTLSVAQTFMSSLSAVMKAVAKEHKEYAKAAKAVAIASAVVDTAVSAVKAFKSFMDIPIVGYALGAAAAAAAVAFGAVEIATISSQSFAHGGVVQGPSTGDAVGVRANGGEMVLTSQQQQNLLNQMNSKGGGGGMNVNITIGSVTKENKAEILDELRGQLAELQFYGVGQSSFA